MFLASYSRVVLLISVILLFSSEVFAQDAVDIAVNQIGDAYDWGGNGPDAFDCSGLTSYSYEQTGIILPRTALEQSEFGDPVEGDLQRGDLVFFETDNDRPGVVTHVGIYEGNNILINANSVAGEVRRNDISTPYWAERLLFARRVISPHEPVGSIEVKRVDGMGTVLPNFIETTAAIDSGIEETDNPAFFNNLLVDGNPYTVEATNRPEFREAVASCNTPGCTLLPGDPEVTYFACLNEGEDGSEIAPCICGTEYCSIDVDVSEETLRRVVFLYDECADGFVKSGVECITASPPELATIQGIVRFFQSPGQPVGDPVVGAIVSLYEFDTLDLIAETETNSSGFYQFESIAPGDYSISAQKDSMFGGAVVNVEAGETIDEDITIGLPTPQ